MVKQQTACNMSNILLSTLEFLSFKHLVSETKELNLKVHDAFGSYITYSPIIHHSLPSANNPETSTETTIFYIPRDGNGNTRLHHHSDQGLFRY